MAIQIAEYQATLDFNAEEFTKGIKDSESKLSNFADKLKSGISGAANIAAGAIGAVTAATTALVGTTVNEMSQLAATGDAIDKASQKAHMSAESYQEWDFILQHCGSDASVLQGTMKTLTSAVDKGADAFGELGINLEDLDGMAQEDIFSLVIEQLQGVEDESKRTALATELLGKGGTEMAALLNTSAEDVAAMKEQVHELGGILSDEAVSSAANFQDKLQDLTVSIQGIKNKAFAQFLPAASDFLEGLTKIFTGDDSGLELINQGINGFVDNLTDSIPKALQLGSSIILSLGQAITNNAGKLITAGADAVLSLLNDGILPMLPQLASVAVQAVQSVAESLSSSLPVLIPTITSTILEIGNVLLTDGLPVLLQATIDILSGIAEGLLSAAPILLEQLPVILQSALDFIFGSADQLISAAISLVGIICDSAPDIISGLISALPSILSTIFTTIQEQAPALLQSVMTLVQELCTQLPNTIMLIVQLLPELVGIILDTLLGDGLPALIDCTLQMIVMLCEQLPTIILEIVKILPDLIGSIISSLLALSDKMAEAGVKLFVSLVQNAPEILSKLCEAAGQLIKGVLNVIREAYSSFKSIGSDLLSKLKEGLVEKKNLIINSIKEIGKSIIDAIKGIFFGTGSSGSGGIREVGRNLIEGLISGIKEKATAAVDTVKNVASSVWSSVTDFFGIHSPSTLLAYGGRMLMEGLEQGITENSGDAVKAAESVTDALNDVFSQIGANFDIEDFADAISGNNENISSIRKQMLVYEGREDDESQGKMRKLSAELSKLEEAKNEKLLSQNDKIIGSLGAALDDFSRQNAEQFNALVNAVSVGSSLGFTPGSSNVINNGGDTTITQDYNVTIEIDHVEDYDDLVSQMKHDGNFEKMIQSMTLGKLSGKGSLDKYKY